MSEDLFHELRQLLGPSGGDYVFAGIFVFGHSLLIDATGVLYVVLK